MEKLSLRILKPNELSVLTELFTYNDVSEMITSNTKKIEELLEKLQNGEIDVFCLYLEERLIGELRVAYTHKDSRFAIMGKRAYLYALRIHKDFQGNGYGKYLLDEVINNLYQKGYKEYTIGVEEDNKPALHLYSKLGFSELVATIDEEYQGDSYTYSLYCLKKQQI